jgi:hypothetical protein
MYPFTKTCVIWMRVAEDRARWRAIREAYVKQWTDDEDDDEK